MDNRIEEVKKICPRCNGTGKIIWHDKMIGKEFEGIDRESPCPDCQLFSQPLDDELREKMLLTPEEIRAIPFYKLTPDKALPYSILKAQQDKDLALLQPKIEEARMQGMEGQSTLAYNTGKHDGRRQEREGIVSKFENEYEVIQTFGKPSPYITFKVKRSEWQALKGGG